MSEQFEKCEITDSDIVLTFSLSNEEDEMDFNDQTVVLQKGNLLVEIYNQRKLQWKKVAEFEDYYVRSVWRRKMLLIFSISDNNHCIGDLWNALLGLL